MSEKEQIEELMELTCNACGDWFTVSESLAGQMLTWEAASGELIVCDPCSQPDISDPDYEPCCQGILMGICECVEA